MKATFDWLALACALVFADSARAQGKINFNNRYPPTGVYAPVTLGSTSGAGPGPNYSAALYLFQNSALTLIPNSITTFRDGSSNPELAKYVNALAVTVPGTIPEQAGVIVRMRAWLSAAGSYENASAAQRGESGDLLIEALGGSLDPSVNNNLPASFTGFVIGQGFDFSSNGGGTTGGSPGGIVTPEPATWALFMAGAFAFALRSQFRKH